MEGEGDVEIGLVPSMHSFLPGFIALSSPSKEPMPAFLSILIVEHDYSRAFHYCCLSYPIMDAYSKD